MRLIRILALVAVLVFLAFTFRSDIQPLLTDVAQKAEIWLNSRTIEVTKDIQKEVVTSGPLRVTNESQKTEELSAAGVFLATNKERTTFGLSSLRRNSRLDEAAVAKVRDMFSRQYFEHTSPTGEGPGDLAEDAGYAYILVGENLALGNFAGDEALVQAWMDSPGHRENILHSGYREIGIAVQKGIFEGRSVWLAVQEFGTPISACNLPSETLGSQIDALRSEADALEVAIREKREEIDNMRPKRGPEYNRVVTEYNEIVDRYNGILEVLKTGIAEYNEQVTLFNDCSEEIRTAE